MQTQLRIVAGSLRGRKLTCTVEPGLRPIPDRVREALFSILGNAVPDRPFYDLFAGTGAVGLEALSRGAGHVTFVERDVRVAGEILNHLKAWNVADRATVQRGDVYRWLDRWLPPMQSATVFLGPPYPDFDRRTDDLMAVFEKLQSKLPFDSVLVVQSDRVFDAGLLPQAAAWEERLYGRTRLSFWTRDEPLPSPTTEPVP